MIHDTKVQRLARVGAYLSPKQCRCARCRTRLHTRSHLLLRAADELPAHGRRFCDEECMTAHYEAGKGK